MGPEWTFNGTSGITNPLQGDPLEPFMDIGTLNLSAGVGGTTAGTVEANYWADYGNAPFGKTTPLTSMGPMPGLGFSSNAFSTISPVGPYSLTVQVIITHAFSGITTLDAAIKVRPPACDCVLSMTCPVDLALNCGSDTSTNSTGMPTLTTQRDCQPVLTYFDTITPGTCVANYVISRAWTATPQCGPIATCTQTITVQDTNSPVITCIGSKTVECGQTWTFDAPDTPRSATPQKNPIRCGQAIRFTEFA